ncbi:hypothetical protein [Pontivivens nitratireducens]|uniref:Uncharacterized protein n=1 Tax=Pontivivens nitratireducens TaxID=2758038 RepID=A0A6G7VN50_9RHOB|nr:hypothetical protein [Pontibrevibacter nitratireducens]QIK41513.1 hypothetical protein G8E03_12505 [Pontibrevibacter nitratireducens]
MTQPQPTALKSDAEVLTSKIDEMRVDIRKLMPLLNLLEPTNPDQMTSFAERLLAFMQQIDEGYQNQAEAFHALRTEVRDINAKLNFLIEGS